MLPLGYKVEDGKIEIDEQGAEKIRKLFEAYLDGHSMITAGKKVGIRKNHSSIAGMLCNRHYLGDDIFPRIIDKDSFQRVVEERAKRTKMGQRITEPGKPGEIRISLKKPKEMFEDPFKQAEYAYSLIQTMVITYGT